MTYKIVIPVFLGGEIVTNLLSSLDIDPNHVILVDNSPHSLCKNFEGKGYEIYYYPENIGVARAWNIGLKAGCDWTFIASQAAVFPNGFSNILLDVSPTAHFSISSEGWHFVGIARETVNKIGYFDTNFYPAYFEDADYARRMNLAGLDGDNRAYDLAITSVGSSSGLGADINFQALYDYFTQKWGAGPNDDPEKLFKLPFGDKSLHYFPERSVKELKNKYGYK